MARLRRVLIPAAGYGQRFRNVGISQSKPLIKFRRAAVGPTQSMVEWAASAVPGAEVFVGVRSDEMGLYCYELRHTGINVLNVGHSTQGQASTIYRMLDELTDEGYPFLVLNSDQMFHLDPWEALQTDASASVLVMTSDNPAHSFVSSIPRFREAHEKKPISPFAIAGAFWFRDVNEFRLAYTILAEKGRRVNNELYLSELLNYLPGLKDAVSIEPGMLSGWGTPGELFSDPKVYDVSCVR